MGTLRDELKTIYEANGKLTGAMVVAEATNKHHPLHSRFDWDNKVAGPRWREHQARELIRSVKIKYAVGNKIESCRFYVSVQGDDGSAYRAAEEVAQDEILTAIVLRDMERDWKQLRSRYGHFKEFSAMVKALLDAA